jgi:hypothetical protein
MPVLVMGRRRIRPLLFSLSLLLLGTLFTTVDAFNCGVCEDDKCPEAPNDCPGGITKDLCGCCPACARVVNQTCGGQFGALGTCDIGLTCVISPANGQSITGQAGVCLTTNQKENPEDLCGNCQLTSELLCPNDSLVIYKETECCPEVSCHCKPCPDHPCPLGSLPQVLQLADGTPGFCCDLIKCIPRDKENPEELCGNCQLTSELLCPNDSQVIYKETECCPEASCHCKPCPDHTCPLGSLSQVLQLADGTPGFCCDLIECVPRDVLCANVTCWNETRGADDEDYGAESSGDAEGGHECPPDSLPRPPEVTQGGCCVVPTG